jgi:hypothetical protein
MRKGEIFVSPFFIFHYFSNMNKWFVILFAAFLLIGSASSCKKCYNCRKKIVVEIDNQMVETDEYYEEDVCTSDEKDDLESDGFRCSNKR